MEVVFTFIKYLNVSLFKGLSIEDFSPRTGVIALNSERSERGTVEDALWRASKGRRGSISQVAETIPAW